MTPAPTGNLRTFLTVWFGQLISMIGTGLTSFGLGVWVFQRTGSATDFALISVFAVLPGIVISPIAGALVDRYDRRRVMMVSDLVAGLSTVAVALLLFGGQLEIWHIWVSAAVGSSAQAFQYPAYAASVSLLIPKQHLGRASGLMRSADAVSLIIAPALAGFLVGRIGLEGIILIDFATFLFAVGTLLVVRFPPVPRTAQEAAERRTFGGDIVFGWRYLWDRPGLFWLMIYFTSFNFLFSIAYVLLTPLILSFSTTEALGSVVSAAGAGLLIGSILMTTWGGFKRRVLGAYWYGIGQAFTLVAMGAQENILLIALAFLILTIGGPIADASVDAIRMKKVAPSVQGRVFSTSRMLSWAGVPLAYLIAGPLADRIFEPAMREGGSLAPTVGQWIGVGEGRGIGLLFIVAGVLSLLATIAAVAYPRMRHVEDELPDYLPDPPATEPTVAEPAV